MSLSNENIKEQLVAKFGEVLTEWNETYNMLSFSSPKDLNLKVLSFLFDEPSLSFQFLTDLTAVHYPDRTGEEIAVVYHLHNLRENTRLRFKVYAPISQPDVYSATALFSSANWMERETFDFFGIQFISHPNLTRILNMDNMDYHPMRKEYALEDETRKDKNDTFFGR